MNALRKLCNWYFSRKALPYWSILAMDCTIVFLSGLFVYYFQHGGLSFAIHFWQVTFGLCVCLVLYVFAFFIFHTYHGVMRYSIFVDFLPRDRIEIDMNAIGNMLRGKRILITGAAGSIGSEMSRQDSGMRIVPFFGQRERCVVA